MDICRDIVNIPNATDFGDLAYSENLVYFFDIVKKTRKIMSIIFAFTSVTIAKQIAAAKKEGDSLGLTADELAFYDALTKPQAIKDFYENEELIAITKELTDTLRKNKTIDWQKR